jgi:predicted anti-sigma-YlaC factor YlaD
MSHQPYETWIFSEDPISLDQRDQLQNHMKQCEQCQNLYNAISHVDTLFISSTVIKPAQGFTQRWYGRLEQKRQQALHRRLWLIPAGLLGTAGIIFSILLLLNIQGFNWLYGFGQLIANLSLLAARTRQILTVLNSSTQSLRLFAPLLIIIGLSIFCGILAVLAAWLNAIIHLYFPVQQGVTKS